MRELLFFESPDVDEDAQVDFEPELALVVADDDFEPFSDSVDVDGED